MKIVAIVKMLIIEVKFIISFLCLCVHLIDCKYCTTTTKQTTILTTTEFCFSCSQLITGFVMEATTEPLFLSSGIDGCLVTTKSSEIFGLPIILQTSDANNFPVFNYKISEITSITIYSSILINGIIFNLKDGTSHSFGEINGSYIKMVKKIDLANKQLIGLKIGSTEYFKILSLEFTIYDPEKYSVFTNVVSSKYDDKISYKSVNSERNMPAGSINFKIVSIYGSFRVSERNHDIRYAPFNNYLIRLTFTYSFETCNTSTT